MTKSDEIFPTLFAICFNPIKYSRVSPRSAEKSELVVCFFHHSRSAAERGGYKTINDYLSEKKPKNHIFWFENWIIVFSFAVLSTHNKFFRSFLTSLSSFASKRFLLVSERISFIGSSVKIAKQLKKLAGIDNREVWTVNANVPLWFSLWNVASTVIFLER